MKSPPPFHTSEFLNVALQKALLNLEAASQAYGFSPNSYTNEVMHTALSVKLAVEEAITSFEHFSTLMSVGLASLQDGSPLVLTIEPNLP